MVDFIKLIVIDFVMDLELFSVSETKRVMTHNLNSKLFKYTVLFR